MQKYSIMEKFISQLMSSSVFLAVGPQKSSAHIPHSTFNKTTFFDFLPLTRRQLQISITKLQMWFVNSQAGNRGREIFPFLLLRLLSMQTTSSEKFHHSRFYNKKKKSQKKLPTSGMLFVASNTMLKLAVLSPIPQQLTQGNGDKHLKNILQSRPKKC